MHQWGLDDIQNHSFGEVPDGFGLHVGREDEPSSIPDSHRSVSHIMDQVDQVSTS